MIKYYFTYYKTFVFIFQFKYLLHFFYLSDIFLID